MMSGLSLDGAHIFVNGPFDDDNAMTVQREGASLLGHVPTERLDIVVDMKGVTNVGSSTLAVIFSWCRLLKLRGQTLVLESVPDNLLSIMRVCGVEELIEVRSP